MGAQETTRKGRERGRTSQVVASLVDAVLGLCAPLLYALLCDEDLVDVVLDAGRVVEREEAEGAVDEVGELELEVVGERVGCSHGEGG